jgi:hypothetical protein
MRVKQRRTAPDKVERRERKRRAPQLELSVTCRTAGRLARFGAMYLQAKFRNAIATRNLQRPRNEGMQLAAIAARSMQPDSIVVNQNES